MLQVTSTAGDIDVGHAALLGRSEECATLERLLADSVGGRSRAIVLRGEAGVGKSALLAFLSRQSGGRQVATAAGIESEMELAYSGLHQLCAPMLDHVERLPGPQRMRSRRSSA